jgi:hypothetical protein
VDEISGKKTFLKWLLEWSMVGHSGSHL